MGARTTTGIILLNPPPRFLVPPLRLVALLLRISWMCPYRIQRQVKHPLTAARVAVVAAVTAAGAGTAVEAASSRLATHKTLLL
jgi:hypothetical protein